MNRGNHEDFAVCVLYGFQSECCVKYDEETFGMFSELFQHLPLFAIVNDEVFVVHGGLFHDKEVTVHELNDIRRYDFVLREIEGVNEEVRPPEEASGKFYSEDTLARHKNLIQLQREAMWTDPQKAEGYGPSGRGLGFTFGPDVTRAFLQRNGLKMVVRSHECVFDGFDTPYSGEDEYRLVTVFSASNYGGGRNSAAYMCFYTEKMPESVDVPESECGLCFTVMRYSVVSTTSEKADGASAESNTPLHEVIIMNADQLEKAFEEDDPEQTGEVTKFKWAEVMQRVTGLKIRWLTMVPFLIPEDRRATGSIDYRGFLKDYRSLSDLDEDG